MIQAQKQVQFNSNHILLEAENTQHLQLTEITNLCTFQIHPKECIPKEISCQKKLKPNQNEICFDSKNTGLSIKFKIVILCKVLQNFRKTFRQRVSFHVMQNIGRIDLIKKNTNFHNNQCPFLPNIFNQIQTNNQIEQKLKRIDTQIEDIEIRSKEYAVTILSRMVNQIITKKKKNANWVQILKRKHQK